jgi:DNA modification methylase
MKRILNNYKIEDCLESLKDSTFKYDYIITSPPDFSEIGLSLKDSYYNWIKKYIENFNPTSGFVTICVTDRRANGGIITKHKEIIDAFQTLNWKVYSYKIWLKSFNIDLYKLPYQHLITFTQEKKKIPQTKRILEDVFCIKPSGFKNSMPVEICERHINSFTNINEIVYDPFLGSGTTAVACKKNNRNWFGSEIKSEIASIIEERLKNET